MQIICTFKCLFVVCFTYIYVLSSWTNASLDVSNETSSSTEAWTVQPQPVRCFCNLPECVQKGYMCKSLQGVCFSKYLLRSHHLASTEIPDRGCLELLPQKQRRICRRRAHGEDERVNQQLPSKTQPSQKSYFECCLLNVCNFGTALPTVHTRPKQDLVSPRLSDRADWFRMVTIAVPILGCLILICLILFAAKMLSQDTKIKDTYQGVPTSQCVAMPSIMIDDPEVSKGDLLTPFGGQVNLGLSSSTIYSKDFAHSIDEERVPLNRQYDSNSI